VHKLLARQLAKAAKDSGEFDLQALLRLVCEAYQQSDNDRRRTDRSISLMIGELEQLNHGLDRLVQERTAGLLQRETELQAQNLRFDAALENMPHGLCMFDRQERLIVCNERYREMYGLTPDQTKLGSTIRSILEARVATCNGLENAETYVEQRLAEIRKYEPYYTEKAMRDGRTFAVNHRPMRDGGWVAIHQDITAQRRAEMQITYIARHDGLTGLANRAVLREKIEGASARLHRDGNPFAIFMLDLDLFKTVNDSFGHPVGDELLKLVAARLAACVRRTDAIARLGGDEFAILTAAEGDQGEAAVAVANRLVKAVTAPL